MPDDNVYISKALRNIPQDATVGQVDFAPPTFAERMGGPRGVLTAASMLPVAGAEVGAGALGRYIADRRVNAMFDPAQKAFWKLFGKRAAD